MAVDNRVLLGTKHMQQITFGLAGMTRMAGQQCLSCYSLHYAQLQYTKLITRSQGYLISIFIQYVLSCTNDINEGAPWKLQICLQCPLCLHKAYLHLNNVHDLASCWQVYQTILSNTSCVCAVAICRETDM